MILKYEISDNQLKKINPTDYPTHHQNNITLQFQDKDNIINNKTYAYIKTHDKIEKIKITKQGEQGSCELPPFTTHHPFFKLKVITIQNKQKMVTNELIIPVRTNDYLDYQRTKSKIFPKPKTCYDKDFPRKK